MGKSGEVTIYGFMKGRDSKPMDKPRDRVAWLNSRTGAWIEVKDHVRFLRKRWNAMQVGFGGPAAEKFRTLDPWEHRIKCLVAAMEAGLVQIRQREDDLCFDFTIQNSIAVPAIRKFLDETEWNMEKEQEPIRARSIEKNVDYDKTGGRKLKVFIRNLDTWMAAWVDPDDIETASLFGTDRSRNGSSLCQGQVKPTGSNL